MRIDVYIKNEYGLSRSKAQELISNSCVLANGKAVSKPSFDVNEGDKVEIVNPDAVLKYVSRGGYKLEKALDCFGINVEGRCCMDIGASTGGFTDCMLQNGAKKVYAVDVGSSQLVEKLCRDSRVEVMENTDIRNVSADSIEPVDFICTDVSFISLENIMENISELLCDNGEAVLLVKPQFEAGRENISSGGIVRDKRVHRNVVMNVINSATNYGLYAKKVDYSPIKGGNGNIEYILYLVKEENGTSKVAKTDVESVVEEAHKKL
jgi:23S rRNA (cytidine1920-2'-O)/16S rRNA (cytidine1409-2'-O)-methyltransferase